MRIEEQLLADSIRRALDDGQQALYHLEHLSHGNTPENVDVGDHADELRDAEEALSFQIEKAYREICILAERLSLPLFRADVRELRDTFKDLSELHMVGEDLASKPLLEAHRMFASLAAMTDGRAVTGLGVFETIIENTAKIVEEANLSPTAETPVRNAVLRVMQKCFRDTVKDPQLSKPLKNYKPDIGVRSLLAAVEYKFADTEAKAKSALDAVYADMRGYSGDHDWRSFYAVFYLTKPFYTQKDVTEEFRVVKADLSWTPIVVVRPSTETMKKRKGKGS